MTEIFDKDIHRLVAIPFKDGKPGGGPNIFVQVDGGFLNELREAAIEEREAQRGTEIVVREKLPVETIEQIHGHNTALTDLERRIAALEAVPTPKTPANDQVAVPKAFGDLVDRVFELEKRLDETPAEPAELGNDIKNLGLSLADMSAAVFEHIVVLQKRIDACEARFNELPNVLAQIQAERRRIA